MAFTGYVTKTGFPDKQQEASFLRELEQLQSGGNRESAQIAALQAQVNALARQVAAVASMSQAPAPAPPASAAGLSVTINAGPFQVGALVAYWGGTAVLADCTDTAKRANWIVTSSSGSQTVLALLSPETDILETGTGTDGSGNLYLYTGGGVTRNRAQIEESDGGPVSGVALFQIVGYYNGLSQAPPASGYVRGAFFATPGRSL
jgi:hypothetical protein